MKKLPPTKPQMDGNFYGDSDRNWSERRIMLSRPLRPKRNALLLSYTPILCIATTSTENTYRSYVSRAKPGYLLLS